MIAAVFAVWEHLMHIASARVAGCSTRLVSKSKTAQVARHMSHFMASYSDAGHN